VSRRLLIVFLIPGMIRETWSAQASYFRIFHSASDTVTVDLLFRESVNHDYQADVHALSIETSSLQVHVVWHTSHVRSSSSLATSYLNCTPSGHRHTSHHQSSRFLQGIQISSSTLLYFGSQHHYYTGANKT
jgi:hypothetical protein